MAKNIWDQDPIVGESKSPWEQDQAVAPEEVSQLLDPAKMIAAGAVGPTAAIPLGIESAIRNVPRQVVEQQGITPVSKVGPMTFAEELVKKGPGQLFTNTARAFIKSATGESFEKQQERQTQDQIAVDRAISKLPRIPGLSQLADAGEKVSERFRESVSAAGKQAIADSQVEGNLLEAIQNRSVENLSFGKNPSFMGYALQGSQVLGSLAPIITTAVVTRGSSKAVGTVGFGMGAGEAVQDAQKYVSSLSDEQLMQSSPYFKKMVEDGVNPAEARQVVVDKAAEYAAQLQGSVSAFGSVITGKLITGQFDKLMTGPVKNRLGRIALGTTAGAAEEGTQEFLEGIAKDLGINKSVIKEIGEESFANFVLGAMGGAGPGAYRGAVAKTKEEAEKAAKAPTQADIDAQMRLDLGEGVPPTVPPAAPAAAPAVTPAITPAPSATIEEAEVEAIAPAPRVAPTPTPMLLQTAGLPPEVAGQVQNLEGQFQMIEQRKLDPNLTEEELQIFNERQNIIQQEIAQLIQAPQAPQAPIAPPAAQPIDLKSEQAYRMRITVEELEKDPEKVTARNVNPLAKELDLEIGATPQETLNTVKETLGMPPVAPVAEEVVTEPEIVQSFPMGENSELQVIKNDKGYVTNLYDKDANQYLGTMKLFPTETFGEEAEAKAIEFAKSEADKAVKYEPPAAPVEEAPLMTKEEADRIVKAEINRQRQAEQRAAAEAVQAAPPEDPEAMLKRQKGYEEARAKYAADMDPMFVYKTLGLANKDIELRNEALPELKKMEEMGLIEIKKGRRKSFYLGKGAKEAGLSNELSFSGYQDVVNYLSSAPKEKPKTVVELPKKEEEPAIQVTPNKIFTEDAATKARNRLRSKLNRLNSGIDPEFLIDGITLSGYHIEKGARTFAAYAKAMIDDLGDKVKPYLKQWYNAVRDDPSAKSLVDDMDTYEQVQKAELPDTTEGAVDLMDPSGKFKIAEDISKHFLAGNGFKDILDARKFITNITGQKIEAGTAQAKEADEAIEVGVVLASRQIAKGDNVYDNLVDLYNRQPNLSVRTSTSISEQAYSTPAPLAYVASQLAGINKNTTVYEPTAGNGMLLIDASPKNVIANELNGTRYEMLERVMDGATINNENAVKLDISKEFDAIIANPPFGVVKDRDGKTISYEVDGLKTNEIDHAIVFKALGNMKNNGRAVLIVGGVMGKTDDARRDGYRSSASKRGFYYNLYKKYNVVDHFTVSGDLYKKQGAAYPVDVIVISGKEESARKLPAADLPKVYSSYEQLKEKLDEASRMESRPISVTRPDSGAGATRPSERELLDTGTVKPSAEAGEKGGKPAGGVKESLPAAPVTDRTEAKPSGADIGGKEPTAKDISELQRPEQKPVPSTGEGVGPRVGGVTGGGKPTGLGGPSVTADERVKPPVKEEETQYQITYISKSKLKSVETLMPKGMADAIRRSLDRLEEKVGDIDAYVAKSLKMDLATLGDYFSAEQADALALSIDNAEKGKGFIIGDQTGIGKGRVVAAMIKYAIENGKIPIFVTEKTNLYADMVRDLNEIGMSDFLDLEGDKQKILMTNSSSKDKVPYTFLKDENGEKVEKKYILQSPKKGKSMGKLLDAMVQDGNIGDYKVIFTTYDQMKTVKKGQTTPRREFLRHFANDNYVILDESHNAGGTGTPDPKKENVAKFARGLINTSYGSFFSSATYAKRANVMDLYASTDMSLAVDNIQELATAIQNGGVPMQQVVATMLAEAGQYIRREKSFEGITYETKEVAIDKAIAENMATTLRSVLAFSSAKESVVDQMQVEEDESGGILVDGNREKSEVEGDNFGATMHNLIGQMLLSLKAEEAANYAIERLKKGEKVVLTVSNTMGSFLNEFAADMGIKKGDPVDLSFKDLFLKYLNKQRIVKIKNEFGEPPEFIDGVKEVYLTDDMLGPKLTKVFNDIQEQIENADYGTAPISPIDYMQAIIRKAGYKTAEITGRNLVIDYSTPALILDSRDSGIMQRLNSIGEFNNSDLNVMTLNRAGSTGLSLHSSERFKNQNKRHMIVVQADADIAVHMQMLGRVNRTGQVNKPAYTQLGGDIPAENRPMAVLAKKMASLNANTTAGQKSAVTAENVVDFVNEYGGQIAQEFLIDNPWFNETIGNRIQVKEESSKGTDEDIRKLTGYIPVFPIKQQEEIYQDLLDRYSSLIDSVNSMGVNKLEAKAMDLDAKVISSKQITEDKGEDSPFAKPAYMEQLDVKRTVKPLSSKEVKDLVQKNLDGRQPYEIARNLKAELRTKVADFMSSKKKEMLEKETDPVTINKFEKQTELTESHVDTILDNYRIGDTISIKNPEGLFTYGVITDVFTKGKSVNPAAASAWKMQIALANGESKSLNLSFSQIGGLNGFTLAQEDVVDYINMQTGQGQSMRIYDIFDAGSEERREKRWMVTGNLLAGYAQYPGQIVFYKKDDGTVAQGILQSRLFDFEKSEKEAPVKIKTAEDVMRFLEINGATVGSKDKVFQVSQRYEVYTFTVPRSKKVSGAYLTDENLRQLGVNFTSSGNQMMYRSYDKKKVQDIFDYLINERQTPIVAISPLDKAREMFAPKTILEDVTGITPKKIEVRRDEIRAEQIKRSAALSRGISAIKRQIIKGNIGINIQRELTFLEQAKKEINKEIAKTKPPRKTAEWFRAKAAAELAADNIDYDTYRVVDALATRYPAVLDGMSLSVQQPKVAGVSGNFDPIKRLVTIFKRFDIIGPVPKDSTMRHEIAHSMEQMMTPEAQTAVVNAWADALQKAIEENTDQPSQDYFEAVFNYLQKPTEENYRKATNALPDYSLYQFINPSEYWAVNAEPLLKAQLGSGWQRFKKAMQRLLETIKDVLGFDNKRAIHREFARIMSGDQQRITNKMLVQYVIDNADALKFLNNVEDFDKKFQEDGLNHTPVKPSRSVKDMMLGGFRGARQVYKDAKDAPLLASQAMGGKIVRAITSVRNKNIWYGAGLEMADLAMQKARGLEGMLRDGEMRAVASIAVTNALHAGHIASEVIIRGALAFNAKTQMFQAIRRPFSMANVLMAKHDLIERLGLQRATDMINTFFEAKRSKSIMDEFESREKELQDLNDEMRDPKTSVARQALLLDEILQAEKGLRMINIAKKKVRFDEEQIKFYGDLEKTNPELRTMLDNWTKVNDNMIDMMLFGKIISEKRAKQLKGIKDYVPWYRIQDDMEDLHQASQMGGVKRLTNVGKEKRFEDTVVVKDIDDIVDNMLHNVAMITRNSMRNYAANRVAQEYATRNKKGQIAVFPEEGRTPEGAVRTNILVNGRRIIIEIKDPLIAESVIGMENISMPAMDMLGALANGLRRGVTLWPQFQIRQLFMDAPTAALVTGLKDPTRVWAGTFRGFIKALQSDDPVVDMLKSYGIGGYQSYTRTPEIEYKQQIGLLEKNKFDSLMSFLDRVGDASDYGQRVSVYNNTLRQTGDEMLALLQANNVIDFLKRGSARHAQVMTKTVSFMNAYAQQIDILAMSLVGKRLTGKARGAALAQLAKTGATFGFYVLLYSMAVGDDDEYQKLDDQTKVRNIFLSKTWTGLEDNILIPMHTSASFMFKSIPELIYNYVTTKGTDNEMDGTRLRTALFEAAADSLLGPNPVPTGIKPAVEILLNRNFFTGGTVTPKGMEDLDAVEQYTAATSQLGKVLSALTGIPFTEKRVLNPIEADHFVRGLFGTTGSAVQWLSNMFAEDRPSATTRQNPLYGSFVAPDVARGNEELFYDFKSKVDNKYETYMKLLERDKADEADKYFNKHADLISARDYVTGMEVALRDINRQIRNTGEVKDKKLSPEQRRQEIIDLQRAKQEMLEGIVQMRLDSGL
jgi:hypothetical protein